jgi:hypothetical protein
MTTYLKAESETALYVALEAAGIVTLQDDVHVPASGVFLDVIGTISSPTGEVDAEGNAISAPIPGYHANIYSAVEEWQLALLPVIEPPANPVRVAA